jgi:hypothetical protein
LTIGWDQVRELLIEGGEETRRRVTATRMLAVGLLAFAVPKDEQRNHSYITAVTDDGHFIVRTNWSPHEARAKLGALLRRVAPANPMPACGTADTLANALAQIVELHDRGALDDEEFVAAKRPLLELG